LGLLRMCPLPGHHGHDSYLRWTTESFLHFPVAAFFHFRDRPAPDIKLHVSTWCKAACVANFGQKWSGLLEAQPGKKWSGLLEAQPGMHAHAYTHIHTHTHTHKHTVCTCQLTLAETGLGWSCTQSLPPRNAITATVTSTSAPAATARPHRLRNLFQPQTVTRK